MQNRWQWALVLGAVLALGLAPDVATAQAKNPCNPCGGNGKAENPCNPCGGAKGKTGGMVAVNPCHAKMGTIFYVGDAVGRDSVSFTSDAPLESFVGTTTKISGYIVFDPANPTKGGTGMFQVPVATIDTGIPLRDEHLRSEGWLDAAKNPLIKYEIGGAKDVTERSTKGGATTYALTLVGTFHLNGKSKPLDIPATISYMKASPKTQAYAPGDLLAARANFSIDMTEFGITGPAGMDMVGATVTAKPAIQVRFTATTQRPGGAENPCNPCNPCGGKKKAENPCNPCGGEEK